MYNLSSKCLCVYKHRRPFLTELQPQTCTALTLHARSVAKHALSAHFWRETLESCCFLNLLLLLFAFPVMDSDQEAAGALNRAARDGHDLLGGGADSHAFQDYFQEYFTRAKESMSPHLLINNSLHFVLPSRKSYRRKGQ